MKRILVTETGEREVEITPGAAPSMTVEAGTTLVLDGGRVHRVTRAGDRLLVNGKAVRATLEDPRDRRRGAGAGAGAGHRDVKAAMPGKVIKVLVEAGQHVEAGTGLLILEAMKMQNEVRSPGAGHVGSVRVGVGDTVAAGQVLVTLE